MIFKIICGIVALNAVIALFGVVRYIQESRQERRENRCDHHWVRDEFKHTGNHGRMTLLTNLYCPKCTMRIWVSCPEKYPHADTCC